MRISETLELNTPDDVDIDKLELYLAKEIKRFGKQVFGKVLPEIKAENNSQYLRTRPLRVYRTVVSSPEWNSSKAAMMPARFSETSRDSALGLNLGQSVESLTTPLNLPMSASKRLTDSPISNSR